MTKTDLIKTVAEKAGVTQKTAAGVVDAFVDAVMEAAQKGEEVRIVGFGAFVVRDRAARQGRDPQTGQVIEFKPGKELKEAVM